MKAHNLTQILAQLGIEVISENNKGWLLSTCPFAEWRHRNGRDANPDFWSKPDANGPSGFHCFACKEHGPITSLVKRLGYRRGLNYNSLAVEAAMLEVEGTDIEAYEVESADDLEIFPLNPAIAMALYPKAWEVEEARNYISGRNISEKTCELLELRYDAEQCRVLFPVKNPKHEVFGFTGRSILNEADYPYPKYPKVRDYSGIKKERLLLGEHLVQPGKPFWVVEGLFALATHIELGIREFANPVATMGSTLTRFQRDIFLYYNEPVYLCYDGDMAGTIGLFGAYDEKSEKFEGGGAIDQLKGHLPVLVPRYPIGKDDPDKLTREEVIDMIAKHSDIF